VNEDKNDKQRFEKKKIKWKTRRNQVAIDHQKNKTKGNKRCGGVRDRKNVE